MDLLIFHLLYDNLAHKNQILNWVLFFCAEILPYIAAAGIFAWFWRKNKRNITLVMTALFGAVISRFGVTVLIRLMINRPRPFEELGITPLFSHDIGHSFPSGHAAFFFALIPFIFRFSPKAGWLFTAVAVVMGLARIAAGVHWPSDIVGGAAIGLLTGYLVLRLGQKYSRVQ